MPSHTDLHSRIETNILDGALTEAASILQSFNSNLTDNTLRGKLSSDIEKASDTYGRLLDFFVKGFPDEGRRDMVSDISQKLLSVNDAILRGIQKTDSSDPYYSALRFNETTSVSLENLIGKYKSGIEKISLVPEGEVPPLQLREETEKTATDIFHYIWTMHFADISDYAIVSSVLSDDSIPFSLKAQVVSALMLGNLRFFDQQGLEILIDAASQYDDERLAARAMTATVAVMKRHPRRIRSNRNIRLRIDAWADDIMIYRRLREVMLNMLRSRDTARIESSLKNDIIPGLQKIRPDIIGKMRKAASENDIMSLEENPEWQDLLKKTGIEDKLKELTEIQMDGGDVMMGAFSKLKSYPFFNETANWFLPYTPLHSSLDRSTDILPTLSPLIEANYELCESDRFSMALSLSMMPEPQRRMIMSQFESQFAQLKEVMDDKSLKSSAPEFDNEAKRFMRDFYRYCRLKAGKELSGFLTESFDITALPLLETFTESDEFVTLAAEFYFKRKFYADAEPLFEIMSKRNPSDSSILEKIGYCHYVDKNIPGAISYYEKAEFFNPESQWLIRQLAICHKLNGDFIKGADYYMKALAAEPENYKVIMNLGHCLLESGNVEGALKQYYHADYIRPLLDAPKRALAWAELMKGNLEKSSAYYGKLKQGSPTANDYLNEGHLKFISKDYKGALDDYSEYERLSGKRLDMEVIGQDIDLIRSKGGDLDDLRLLIDMLRR